MNAMTAEAPTAWFQLANNEGLQKLGVKGERAWARVYEGALELHGDAGSAVQDGATVLNPEMGAVLRIAAAEVARMRFGYTESRSGRHFEAQLWRVGAGEPLLLHFDPAHGIACTQAMRGFAALLAGQATPARIEGGVSKFYALLAPALLGIVWLAVVGLALFGLTHEPWWGRLIMVAVPSVFLVFFLWYGFKRLWPRAITHLDDLYIWLPPLPVEPMKSAMRRAGGVLFVLGLFITGIFVGAGYDLSTLPPPSGTDIEGARAVETSTKDWFGRIIGSALGVTSMLAGLQMIVTGRRDTRRLYPILGILFLGYVAKVLYD